MDSGVGNSNDKADPAIWSPPHRTSCPVSQPAMQGLQNPSGTLSFRWLAGDSAYRGGTPPMLALQLPHLEGTALPHRQPIGTSPGSAVSPLPQTLPHVTLCSWSMLHSACPGRAQGGGRWGGGRRRGLAIRAPGTAASSLQAPLYPTHDVGITGMQYSACPGPSGWGEGGAGGLSRGAESVQQA